MVQRRRYATRTELSDLIAEHLGVGLVEPEALLEVLALQGVDLGALVKITVEEPTG